MKKKFLPTILATITLSLIIVGSTFAANPANVNYSVTVEPALNITTSSNKVSLDLNPLNHDFDSQNLTVSVSTNNETGYKLYVNTEKTANNPNGNKLIEKDDANLYIETLSSEVPDNAGSFTSNCWGYKLDSKSTNFSPFTPGTLVLSSKTIADGKTTNDITTMVFAAKVGYETKAGTYNLALNFQATANLHIRTIADAEYMQDVSTKEIGGCPADLTVGQSYALKDSRDGRTYYVAKLKDGNCWMVQNLRFGQSVNVGSTVTLTTVDSDVENSFQFGGRITDGKFHWATVDNVEGQNDSSEYYCTDDYGCYYNWYTITAGSGTTSVSTQGTNVNYSICPAGWTLPTQAEFATLTSVYGGTGSAGVKALLVANPSTTTENTNGVYAPGMLLSGAYDPVGPNHMGVGTRYWARTATSAASAYYLGIETTVRPEANYLKGGGFAARCLLK